MGWLGDGSQRGQVCQAWTAVGLPPRYPHLISSQDESAHMLSGEISRSNLTHSWMALKWVENSASLTTTSMDQSKSSWVELNWAWYNVLVDTLLVTLKMIFSVNLLTDANHPVFSTNHLADINKTNQLPTINNCSNVYFMVPEIFIPDAPKTSAGNWSQFLALVSGVYIMGLIRHNTKKMHFYVFTHQAQICVCWLQWSDGRPTKMWSTHVALCWQGDESHSLISTSHVLPTKPVAEQSHQYLQSITGLINMLTHKLDSFTYNDNIGIRTSNSRPFTATAAAALILLWFFK